MQVIVTPPTGGGQREFVLSLSRADDLVTDGAAVTVAVTCPNIGRETGWQLPGPYAFLSECENLREFHRDLPCDHGRDLYAGEVLREPGECDGASDP
jgi:hypothetical protein